MGGETDGPVERLVKARWLAIGLSPTDLAEVLDAAFSQTPKDGNGPNETDAGRLIQVAEALAIPLEFLRSEPSRTRPEEEDLASAEKLCSLQSLLELRLLRAFHELRDQRTKRLLVHLAEQIVKRQADRRGDAG
jgi:hypothetical protein